jgi:hypothetical protein
MAPDSLRRSHQCGQEQEFLPQCFVNVSQDRGLYTGFAERLTKSLNTCFVVIHLSELVESCGADTHAEFFVSGTPSKV